MEEKKTKNETKLEKLTFTRILIVLICEIVFEFSFGFVFFLFTEYDDYSGPECVDLLFWARFIWKMYVIESSIALICFLIGLTSLCCYRRHFTKIYVSFNNFFKSLIFLASIIILAIITVVYNENEKCSKLHQLTFVWLVFHYSLLAVAVMACCIILVVTIMVYRGANKRDEGDEMSSSSLLAN
jgi:hypothetical protein